MSGKVRLLSFDDIPTFVDEAGLLSFDVSSDPKDKEIYNRNFTLTWLYSGRQMLEFYHRTHIALVSNPRELLESLIYPNLLWVDYRIQSTDFREISFRDHPEAKRHYNDNLNPLRGTWGRRYDLFGLSEDEFEELLDKTTPDVAIPHVGFTAGMEVAKLLREYACSPVPQTANVDPIETEFQERLLALEFGEAFRDKSGVLKNWMEFFNKGLPWFREQLIRTARKGTLTPRLADLVAPPDGGELDRDHEVRFQSSLGAESFRLEAMFFDQFYAFSSETFSLQPNERADPVDEYARWSARLIEAATGPQASGTIPEALRLAERFKFAYTRPLHMMRRRLSRELADAHKADSVAAAEIYDEHETALKAQQIDRDTFMDRVVSDSASDLALPASVAESLMKVNNLATALQHGDSNAQLIEAMGLEPVSLRKQLKALKTVQIPESHSLKLGVLPTISLAAGSDSPLARYASLALIVYAEWLWHAAERLALDLVHDDLKLVLEQEPDEEVRAAQQRLANEGAGILSSEQAHAIMLGEFDVGLLREADDRVQAALATRDLVDLEQSYWQSARYANRFTHKTELMIDLLAPAPDHLLMWRDRGTDIRRAEVDRPLERLTPSLSIKAVITQPPGTPGGLLSGEGRLIRAFAVHWGFDSDYWPTWMRVAAKS
jgi:hypothetical protein